MRIPLSAGDKATLQLCSYAYEDDRVAFYQYTATSTRAIRTIKGPKPLEIYVDVRIMGEPPVKGNTQFRFAIRHKGEMEGVIVMPIDLATGEDLVSELLRR